MSHVDMTKSTIVSDYLTGAVTMNTGWIMDRQGLGILCNAMSGSDGFASLAANKIGDLQSYINSVRIYPINLNHCTYRKTTSDSIRIGPFPMNAAGYVLNNYMSKPIVYDINITNNVAFNNNFLDYGPFRTYEMYLPFYGTISLDPQKFIFDVDTAHNESIHIRVEYIINFMTGMSNITVTSYKKRGTTESNFILLFEDSCKIGEDFPWGMDNSASKVLDMTLGGIKAVGSIGMAMSSASYAAPEVSEFTQVAPKEPNPLKKRGRGRPSKKRLEQEKRYNTRYAKYQEELGAYNEALASHNAEVAAADKLSGELMDNVLETAFTAANSVMNITSFKTYGSTGCPSSSGIPFLGYDKMYLIVKNPHIHEINNYEHYVGNPVADEITLSEHHGLCVMSRVYMEGMTGVLASEVEEIESFLLTGVILPDAT